MIVGLLTGMTRFIWQQVYSEPICGREISNTAPNVISKVHYLHFSIILFLITMGVAWGISLLTDPIEDKHVKIHKINIYKLHTFYFLSASSINIFHQK